MKTANVSRDKIWWLLFTLGVVPRAPIKSLFPSSVCSDYQSPAQQWTLEGGRERERESERDREGGRGRGGRKSSVKQFETKNKNHTSLSQREHVTVLWSTSPGGTVFTGQVLSGSRCEEQRVGFRVILLCQTYEPFPLGSTHCWQLWEKCCCLGAEGPVIGCYTQCAAPLWPCRRVQMVVEIEIHTKDVEKWRN